MEKTAKIEVIDGKHRIISQLGGGGFSEVYLVDGPQGRCALKLLKGRLETLKKSTLDEFKNEFSILKDMRHPNIASILDFGLDETNQRYYYTSEYIRGMDLIKAVDGFPLGEELPLDTVTDLFVQALRALSYLHSYRIYHFDIKSANLLVVGKTKPTLKIIDFGLAGIDPRGRHIGTPSYMAPEIVAREHADGRADLYSLGVLWYTALTHVNPFRSEDRNETMSRHLKVIPSPPSQVIQNIPKWLDCLIMRLLEKNPANRFQSAAAAIREINRAGGKYYPLETQETLLSYLPKEGRFIGREEELLHMEGDIEHLREVTGEGHGCLVSGDIGMGKTRLLRELKYRSQLKDIRIAWASALEVDRFKEWCEELSGHITSGNGCKAFILDDAHVRFHDTTERARLLALLLRSRRPASTSSVWIALAIHPLEDEVLRASLEALLPVHIHVGAFSREQLGEYLISLTGLENPPPLLLEGLYERSEGNPLFVTEMLKSLIEGGGLFDEQGRWNESLFEDVGVDFSKAAIPHTIGELLLKATTSLSDDAKRLLEGLSSIARPATATELGLWAQIKDPYQGARELLQQGLLDRLEGFELRFHNALLGQVIYETMPLARRKQLHDIISQQLSQSHASTNEILNHKSLGSDQNGAYAAAIELGEKALKIGQGEQAIIFLMRALHLADQSDVERFVDVQMKLGEAYLIGHDYTSASKQLSDVETLISPYSDKPSMAYWSAEVQIRLGCTLIKLQEFDRARMAFEHAQSALKAAGADAVRELTIQNFLGTIAYLEGRLKDAQQIFMNTRALAANLPGSERVTNNDLGMVLLAQGELEEAEKIFLEDVDRAMTRKDDLLIARAYYNLAQLQATRSSYIEAIQSYKRCAEVCRRSHNNELLLRVYNGLGNTYQLAGDLNQSLVFYERGLSLHERIGDLRGGAAIAINMGIAEASCSKTEAALDHLIPAVEYLKNLTTKTATDAAALSRGLLELGDLAIKRNRFEEARGHLTMANDIALRVQQAEPQRFWITIAFAELAYAEGKNKEASGLLEILQPIAKDDAERQAIDNLKSRLNVLAQKS